MFDLTGLKLVPSKCGCDGCHFEDEVDCPGDDEPKLEACQINGRNMIFVKGEDNGGTI